MKGEARVMTKEQALVEIGVKLMLLPDTYRCVACGLSKVIEWEVDDDSDEMTDFGLRISPTANALLGWCHFSVGDSTTGGNGGDHCPKCYKARMPS